MKNKGLDSLLDRVKKPIYIYSVVAANIIYILLVFGLIAINKSYVHILNLFTQLFVALFLIYRFHPFREYEYRENDNILIFGAGLFLLTNIGVTNLLLGYMIMFIEYLTGLIFPTKITKKETENKIEIKPNNIITRPVNGI